MGEKSISEKILGTMQELSQIELNETQLLIAIIKKNITELIDKNMSLIESEFSSTCQVYSRNENELGAEKKEILDGYRAEFEKVASKFEEQYMNIALELQESQSNQKIAVTNMKRVLDSKNKYLKSSEYAEFIKKIEELEKKRDNSEVKSEYDSITEYLANVQDPVEIYNRKIDAFAEKYVGYCSIESNCIEKLTKVNEKIEKAISSVMQFDVGMLAKIEKKSIFSIFSKLFNKISGAKKFEKNYIAKKRENLEKVRANIGSVVEEIENETVGIVYALDEYKTEINQAFSEAV